MCVDSVHRYCESVVTGHRIVRTGERNTEVETKAVHAGWKRKQTFRNAFYIYSSRGFWLQQMHSSTKIYILFVFAYIVYIINKTIFVLNMISHAPVPCSTLEINLVNFQAPMYFSVYYMNSRLF